MGSGLRAVGFVVDERGAIVSFGPSAAARLGLSQESAIGRSLWSLVDREDRARCLHALREAVETGAAAIDAHLPTKDGAALAVRLIFATVEGGVAVTVLEAEPQLTAQDWLLATWAHDLRQPIGVIDAAARLLEAQSLDDRARPLVDRIGRAAARLADLANDVLDLECIQLGDGLSLDREEMELTPMVLELARELRITHSGRVIAIDATEALPGRWDRKRLRRIVSNLAENAVRHSPRNTSVQLRCRRGQGSVLFSVDNHSPEIPASEWERMFEPFRRGGERGGAGLGLYIARELARAHGGDVTVWWQAGIATFTLVLPTALADAEAAPRRSHPRLPLDAELAIDAGGRVFAAHARDVSRRGLSFYAEGALLPREQVHIDVVSATGSLSLLATVRWVVEEERGRSRVGVELSMELSAMELERLRHVS
jgi:PAS domain S-box-containing protein